MSDFTVSTDMPAGNIIVDKIEGDTVFVRQDMRDTEGQWFYWAFRVKGAAGRTLTFNFTTYPGVGTRGPAVSTDNGETWDWGDLIQTAPVEEATGNHLGDRAFTWKFGDDDHDVLFSQMLPYGVREWRRFADSLSAHKGILFEESILCKTLKGRDVEYARFGRLDGKAPVRIFLSSRHHCEESSATHVLEGILRTVFADDETGEWIRQNVEIRTVPFVDKDGVVDGDQGKNRRPHDHARDYNPGGEILYPTSTAIMKMLEEWKPTIVMDIHAPWLRQSWLVENSSNEFFYQVEDSNADRSAQQHEFGKILERIQSAGLGYRQEDDFWFGRGWNGAANFHQGLTLKMWAGEYLKDIRLASAFEIPFANSRFKTLRQDEFRAFGKDIIRAFRVFLAQ